MGHIELASPVAHIWFLKSLPSKVGNLLDLTLKELEKVLYFESHIILDAKDTPLQKGQILSEERYRQAREEYGDVFESGIGAEAVQQLLAEQDLEKLSVDLRKEMSETSSEAKRKKLAKRLKIVEAFPRFGQPSRMDDHGRGSGFAPRPEAAGASGRRPFRHFGFERFVPAGD